MKKHLPLILAALLLGACRNETLEPTGTIGTSTPPTLGPSTFPGTMNIEPQDIVLLPGMNPMLEIPGFPTNPSGSPSPVWTSSDPSVVAVGSGGNCGPGPVNGCGRTTAYARSSGLALITASMNGVLGTVGVRVAADRPLNQKVAVEFQIVSVDDGWNAPLITVSAPSESSGFTVHAVRFELPSGRSVQLCGVHRRIPPGESVVLFREVYGDYELEFGGNPGTGEAKAIILLTDGSGAPGTVIATGPVVKGSAPTTYSGYMIDDPWRLC